MSDRHAPDDQIYVLEDDENVDADMEWDENAVRVLLIDDDVAFAHDVSTALSELGCRVEVLRDGNRALARAVSSRFHLVIASAEITGMNGFRLCTRLKKDRTAGQTPVFLLSADADELAHHAELPTKADAYFRKPVTVAELLARVRAQVPALGGATPEGAPPRPRSLPASGQTEPDEASAFAIVRRRLTEHQETIQRLMRELAEARAASHSAPRPPPLPTTTPRSDAAAARETAAQREQLTKKDAEIATLKREAQTQKRRIADLGELADASEKEHAELDRQLESQTHALEQARKLAEAERGERDETKARADVAERTLAELRAELSTVRQHLDSDRSAHEHALEQLRASLEHDRARAEAEHSAERAETEAAAAAERAKGRGDLEHTIQQLNDRIAESEAAHKKAAQEAREREQKLVAEHVAAKGNLERAFSHKETVLRHEMELAQTQAKADAKKALDEALEQRRQAEQALNAERKAHAEELARARAADAAREKDRLAKTAELDELRRKLDAEAGKLDELRAAAEAERARLSSELEAERSLADDQAQAQSRLAAELERLRAERDRAQAEAERIAEQARTGQGADVERREAERQAIQAEHARAVASLEEAFYQERLALRREGESAAAEARAAFEAEHRLAIDELRASFERERAEWEARPRTQEEALRAELAAERQSREAEAAALRAANEAARDAAERRDRERDEELANARRDHALELERLRSAGDQAVAALNADRARYAAAIADRARAEQDEARRQLEHELSQLREQLETERHAAELRRTHAVADAEAASQAALATAAAERDRLEKEHALRIAELRQQQAADMEDRMARIAAEHATRQYEIVGDTRLRYEKELAAREARWQRERDELLSRLAQAASEQEALETRLQLEVAAVQRELEGERSARAAEMEEKTSHLQGNAELLDAQKEENERLVGEITDAYGEIALLESEIVVLRNELVTMRIQLDDRAIVARSTAEQMEQDRALLDKTQKELEETREQLAKLNRNA
jgi:DNA-binding response OmpR family regulator